MYVYVTQNPLRYIDPSGHYAIEGEATKTPKNYAVVQVTTFIPYESIPETAWTGQGDGRDLWEDGTHRTQHNLVVDLDTGKIVYETKDAVGSEVSLLFWDYTSEEPSILMD